MRIKTIICILTCVHLAACTPVKQVDPSVLNGIDQSTSGNSISGINSSYEQATADWDKVSVKCDTAFKNKKIKTVFAKNRCKTDAMQKYIGPYFMNQEALHHYISKRLLLAAQIDKKQVSTDEASIIEDDLWNELFRSENALRSANNAQIAANMLAQAQQRNIQSIAILNALKQPFDSQKRWVDQQNRSIINCYSAGGMTGCRQGY